MNKQEVRDAIHTHIDRLQARTLEIRIETKDELLTSKRMRNEVSIMCLEHAVGTLLELEHNLRLCDCPDEAYQRGTV